MKKIFFLSLIVSLFITSCNEIMPTIPPLGQPEIVTGDANRKILIEEFTGVRCVNCPAGSREIENLLVNFPENLVAISIHAGFFSKPYNESLYDFRTEDANNLVDTYFGGEPFAYPSATVNRQKTQNGSYYVDMREWAGLITTELEEDVQVTLEIEHSYNEATRTVNMDVAIDPKTDIPNDLRISVMITENNVVDYQLLPEPDGKTADYKHKHMLRDIVTSYEGEQVSPQEIKTGNLVNKSFSFTLSDDWVAENCSVIALVHRHGPNDREVLNAEEVHVVE